MVDCVENLRSGMGLTLILVLSGCQSNLMPLERPSVHHVLVAYPERWNEGDRRPCFLGPERSSTVSLAIGQPDIPQLDCDRFVKGELIHRTPQERIFALDVIFALDIRKALESRKGYLNNETAWTCQRKGDAITCAP